MRWLIYLALLIPVAASSQTFSNIDDSLTGFQNPPCSNLNPVGSFCAGGTGNPVSDGTVGTTTTVAVTTTGSHTVTVATSAGMNVGQAFLIGGANSESVAVTGVASGQFTATFSKTHINGVTVQCCFTIQTINNASPSLDGASMELGFTGPVLSGGQTTNVLWPKKVGANSAVTSLQGTWNLIFPNEALVQAKELDQFQFVSGQRFMYGTECDNPALTGGLLRIWNQCANSNGGAWVNTAVSCPLFGSSNVWHSFVLNTHRVPGDTSCTGGNACMYYDSIFIDGVDVTPGGGFAPQCSAPNPEPDNIGIQTQIDEAGTGGAVTEFEDRVSLVLSTTPGNIYFAPTLAGLNNGTSCANAYAYNDATHGWSKSAQQAAGNTLHVCAGTYTGTAGATILATVNSGTSGSPITFVADQGTANFTAPYWGGPWTNFNSAGILVSNPWWVINGDGNLTVQNTQSGTGLTFPATNTTGVEVVSASNVIVENLTVANMCQRSAGDSGTAGQACNVNVDSAGIVVASSSSVTVQYNTVHDAHDCMYYSNGGGDSNVIFQYNTLSRCNWGIGANGSGTASGINIFGNDITCIVAALCNWDDPIDANHHNGVMIDPQSGNTLSSVTIANNYFHDINGNTTAYIFLDPGGSGNVPNNLIYNNVFFTTAGQSGAGNGMITSGIGVTGTQIYNNTLVGPSVRGFGADTNALMKNNIANGQGCMIYVDSGASGNVSAYNDFFGWGPCQSAGQGWYNGSAAFATLAGWQGGSTSVCSGGCDVTGSINTNPNLTTTFTPNSGSPVIGAGTNLTSLGIAALDIGAPQIFGVNYACGTGCTSRPASGAWDMGAYPSTAAVNYTLTVTPTIGGTISSSPAGITSCTSVGGTCSASYTSGTNVSLSQTPAGGYTFSGWGGACSGTGFCSVTMSAAEAVTATYAAGSPTGLKIMLGVQLQGGVKLP